MITMLLPQVIQTASAVLCQIGLCDNIQHLCNLGEFFLHKNCVSEIQKKTCSKGHKNCVGKSCSNINREPKSSDFTTVR